MAPAKGGNSKKEQGQARKAETANNKKQAEVAKGAAKEAESWKDGAKDNSKAEAAKLKAAEAERKKAEKAKLLAEEEEGMASKPKVATGPKKKKVEPRPAGPGAIAASGGILGTAPSTTPSSSAPSTAVPAPSAGPLDIGKSHSKASNGTKKGESDQAGPVHIQATGLDEMLEALDIVNAKGDKDAMGAKAGLIEKHPERRFKAAFEAYFERELPNAKLDHPGLRKQQYHDVLYKQFQKAPENPFNQVLVAYNADKETRVDALQEAMKQKEKKYTMPPSRDSD